MVKSSTSPTSESCSASEIKNIGASDSNPKQFPILQKIKRKRLTKAERDNRTKRITGTANSIVADERSQINTTGVDLKFLERKRNVLQKKQELLNRSIVSTRKHEHYFPTKLKAQGNDKHFEKFDSNKPENNIRNDKPTNISLGKINGISLQDIKTKQQPQQKYIDNQNKESTDNPSIENTDTKQTKKASKTPNQLIPKCASLKPKNKKNTVNTSTSKRKETKRKHENAKTSLRDTVKNVCCSRPYTHLLFLLAFIVSVGFGVAVYEVVKFSKQHNHHKHFHHRLKHIGHHHTKTHNGSLLENYQNLTNTQSKNNTGTQVNSTYEFLKLANSNITLYNTTQVHKGNNKTVHSNKVLMRITTNKNNNNTLDNSTSISANLTYTTNDKLSILDVFANQTAAIENKTITTKEIYNTTSRIYKPTNINGTLPVKTTLKTPSSKTNAILSVNTTLRTGTRSRTTPTISTVQSNLSNKTTQSTPQTATTTPQTPVQPATTQSTVYTQPTPTTLTTHTIWKATPKTTTTKYVPALPKPYWNGYQWTWVTNNNFKRQNIPEQPTGPMQSLLLPEVYTTMNPFMRGFMENYRKAFNIQPTQKSTTTTDKLTSIQIGNLSPSFNTNNQEETEVSYIPTKMKSRYPTESKWLDINAKKPTDVLSYIKNKYIATPTVVHDDNTPTPVHDDDSDAIIVTTTTRKIIPTHDDFDDDSDDGNSDDNNIRLKGEIELEDNEPDDGSAAEVGRRHKVRHRKKTKSMLKEHKHRHRLLNEDDDEISDNSNGNGDDSGDVDESDNGDGDHHNHHHHHHESDDDDDDDDDDDNEDDNDDDAVDELEKKRKLSRKKKKILKKQIKEKHKKIHKPHSTTPKSTTTLATTTTTTTTTTTSTTTTTTTTTTPKPTTTTTTTKPPTTTSTTQSTTKSDIMIEKSILEDLKRITHQNKGKFDDESSEILPAHLSWDKHNKQFIDGVNEKNRNNLDDKETVRNINLQQESKEKKNFELSKSKQDLIHTLETYHKDIITDDQPNDLNSKNTITSKLTSESLGHLNLRRHKSTLHSDALPGDDDIARDNNSNHDGDDEEEEDEEVEPVHKVGFLRKPKVITPSNYNDEEGGDEIDQQRERPTSKRLLNPFHKRLHDKIRSFTTTTKVVIKRRRRPTTDLSSDDDEDDDDDQNDDARRRTDDVATSNDVATSSLRHRVLIGNDNSDNVVTPTEDLINDLTSYETKHKASNPTTSLRDVNTSSDDDDDGDGDDDDDDNSESGDDEPTEKHLTYLERINKLRKEITSESDDDEIPIETTTTKKSTTHKTTKGMKKKTKKTKSKKKKKRKENKKKTKKRIKLYKTKSCIRIQKFKSGTSAKIIHGPKRKGGKILYKVQTCKRKNKKHMKCVDIDYKISAGKLTIKSEGHGKKKIMSIYGCKETKGSSSASKRDTISNKEAETDNDKDNEDDDDDDDGSSDNGSASGDANEASGSGQSDDVDENANNADTDDDEDDDDDNKHTTTTTSKMKRATTQAAEQTSKITDLMKMIKDMRNEMKQQSKAKINEKDLATKVQKLMDNKKKPTSHHNSKSSHHKDKQGKHKHYQDDDRDDKLDDHSKSQHRHRHFDDYENDDENERHHHGNNDDYDDEYNDDTTTKKQTSTTASTTKHRHHHDDEDENQNEANRRSFIHRHRGENRDDEFNEEDEERHHFKKHYEKNEEEASGDDEKPYDKNHHRHYHHEHQHSYHNTDHEEKEEDEQQQHSLKDALAEEEASFKYHDSEKDLMEGEAHRHKLQHSQENGYFEHDGEDFQQQHNFKEGHQSTNIESVVAKLLPAVVKSVTQQQQKNLIVGNEFKRSSIPTILPTVPPTQTHHVTTMKPHRTTPKHTRPRTTHRPPTHSVPKPHHTTAAPNLNMIMKGLKALGINPNTINHKNEQQKKSPTKAPVSATPHHFTSPHPHVVNLHDPSKIRILCFGDSLTAGYNKHGKNFFPYCKRLQDILNYRSNVPVYTETRGIVGEMTHKQMVHRLPLVLGNATYEYDWVIILGGTNDILHVKNFADDQEFLSQLETVWQPRITKDIEKLHQTSYKFGAHTVLITVPENSIEAWPDYKPLLKMRKRINEALRQYAFASKGKTILCDVAKKLPRHTLAPNQEARLWDDHLHMTPDGYSKMAGIISDCLRPYLP